MGKWSVGKDSGSGKIKGGRPLRSRILGLMEASGTRAMISGLLCRRAGRRIKKRIADKVHGEGRWTMEDSCSMIYGAQHRNMAHGIQKMERGSQFSMKEVGRGSPPAPTTTQSHLAFGTCPANNGLRRSARGAGFLGNGAWEMIPGGGRWAEAHPCARGKLVVWNFGEPGP